MCVQSCCVCHHYAQEFGCVKRRVPKICVSGDSLEKTLGERLREERDRLGINQNDFADIGGVKRNSQGNYENDRQRPDTAYLLAISKIGVDVMYVLFGRRDTATGTHTSIENEVLSCFRSLSPGDQVVVHRVATGLAEAAARESQGTLPLE
ncbi:helix-turn-helix transcriptional regulator [Pseudomonas sp. SWRI196]|uniref:Helix-turn-helix transcriptional regulator n=1 Tax=Pseudomonas tehranensis TaxID=2745502 RepID=A0ABR6UPV6_9PSED|nr:helix-turn-helix transcriptional regulator [Pseudomonas tehranensis]